MAWTDESPQEIERRLLLQNGCPYQNLSALGMTVKNLSFTVVFLMEVSFFQVFPLDMSLLESKRLPGLGCLSST